MKGAKDRSIRSSVPPRREVNVQANGTDQKEIAEGLDAIDAAAFKAALSNASTPVTVVATDGPFGRAGLTCSAVSSVCDTPPTILLCVNRQSYATEIGRAHVCTPVTNAQLVFRLLLEKNTK